MPDFACLDLPDVISPFFKDGPDLIANPDRVGEINPGRVRPHSGLDYPAPEGTPLRACMAGRAYIGHGPSLGDHILIECAIGAARWQSIYAHTGAQIGSFPRDVERGELVGRVGMTGVATGFHLHWTFSRHERWGWARWDAELLVALTRLRWIQSALTED